MSTPLFGKRRADALLPSGVDACSADDHSAFFAAVRAEIAASHEDRRMVVPRSFKAAGLAGLVVGCALAGFSVTHGPAAPVASPFAAVAAALGSPLPQNPFDLRPLTILIGLLGGARVAALTLILVHGIMSWIDATGRVAYAAGGAAASALIAAALLFGLAHPPAHGWAVEIAAGAAAGFLYRVFAGVRPAA